MKGDEERMVGRSKRALKRAMCFFRSRNWAVGLAGDAGQLYHTDVHHKIM